MAAIAAIASPAWADAVVFESYSGRRPSDAPAMLAPFRDEFRALGYQVDPKELSERIEMRVSRSGDALTDADLASTLALVDRGYDRWLSGEFSQAGEDLAAALAAFSDRPATVASHARHRDAVFRALVGLSLARARLGDAEGATAAMAELVRSFPDREISRAEYGPEPRTLYAKVKAELDAQPRGGCASCRMIRRSSCSSTSDTPESAS
jgi:hypothetical protein